MEQHLDSRKQPLSSHRFWLWQILRISWFLIIDFLLLIPFLAGWIVIILTISLAISGVIGGFVTIINITFSLPISIFSFPASLLEHRPLLFYFSILLISLGGLIVIGLFYVVKYIGIVTLNYMSWNIRKIRGH